MHGSQRECAAYECEECGQCGKHHHGEREKQFGLQIRVEEVDPRKQIPHGNEPGRAGNAEQGHTHRYEQCKQEAGAFFTVYL